jgi:hypothetical protein
MLPKRNVYWLTSPPSAFAAWNASLASGNPVERAAKVYPTPKLDELNASRPLFWAAQQLF